MDNLYHGYVSHNQRVSMEDFPACLMTPLGKSISIPSSYWYPIILHEYPIILHEYPIVL